VLANHGASRRTEIPTYRQSRTDGRADELIVGEIPNGCLPNTFGCRTPGEIQFLPPLIEYANPASRKFDKMLSNCLQPTVISGAHRKKATGGPLPLRSANTAGHQPKVL